MSRFARGVRVGAVVLGLAMLTSACAQLGDEDKAMLEQARADSAAAKQAAADAADAARRAEQAATDAADAASAARMAAERQDRMLQKTMRK
jgi:hypothetical protein